MQDKHKVECAAVADIREAAKRIIESVEGETFDTFESDYEKQDANLYRIAVIAEAASRVDSMRKKYPEVKWGKIRGMRNIIMHEYDKVDLSIVWEVAIDKIPELLDQINLIYEKECK